MDTLFRGGVQVNKIFRNAVAPAYTQKSVYEGANDDVFSEAILAQNSMERLETHFYIHK
jgi:hypothetical protein